MVNIRYVEDSDQPFWYRLDKHLPEEGFTEKVNRHMGYILSDGGIPAGLLRYNLFWDNLPFCTMLFIDWHMQGKGFGKELLLHWEKEMKSKGYGMVMTSTQTDESAQHFYRKLGYQDAGCLVLDIPGYRQPMEMFLVKKI